MPARSMPRALEPLLVVHIIITAPAPPTAAERAAPAPTATERPKRPPPLDQMWQARRDPPYGARQRQAADAAQRLDDVCRPRAALLLIHLPRARAAELSLSEDFRRKSSLFPWASELGKKTLSGKSTMPDAMGPLFVRSSARATPNSEVVGSQLLIAKLVGVKSGGITHVEPPATRGVSSGTREGAQESEKRARR